MKPKIEEKIKKGK